MNPDILIVTYTYDRYPLVQKSFLTMRENPGMEYRLWVVDNGSAPEQFNFITDFFYMGNIETLILNNKNLGIHHPLNQLMALAKLNSKNPEIKPPEFVMITNDDMIYEPNWLKETYDTYMVLENTENVRVVSPFHCRHLNGEVAWGMNTIKNVEYDGVKYEIKQSVSGNTWFMRGKLWLELLDWYNTNHPTEGGDWQKLEILWKNNYKCAITPKEMAHHSEESQGKGQFNRLFHW
jgi:GT2 family glycosyltransferase